MGADLAQVFIYVSFEQVQMRMGKRAPSSSSVKLKQWYIYNTSASEYFLTEAVHITYLPPTIDFWVQKPMPCCPS